MSARTLVLIPVKPLARAKARLAVALNDRQRQQLARDLLHHVLTAVQAAVFPKDVAVVAGDAAAARIARAHRVRVLDERAAWRLAVDTDDVLPPDLRLGGETVEVPLNRALHNALQWAGEQGYESALVLPADLPLLAPWELDALWEQAARHVGPLVLIVPDHHEEGTNALFLRPPDAIPPLFGRRSFERHYRVARRAGWPVRIYRSPGLCHDLDTVEDLKTLMLDRDVHPLQPEVP